MWFVDFILMHKYLQISEMYSIEKPASAKRADFNRPYRCITVIDAESSEALPVLDLGDNRGIIWLDYEDGLDGPALKDVKTVCESAKTGTVLIVTVNASLDKLKFKYGKDEHGKRMPPGDILQRLAGDLVPQKLPRYALQNTKGFPKFFAELLFIQAKRAKRIVGADERFQPLFNFFYRDGAPMITIGGMIANAEDKNLLDKCRLFEKFDYLTAEKQCLIDVPPLTTKEKLYLDAMLPCEPPPSQAAVEHKGFGLRQAQIDSYHRFYRFYPLFGELVV